MKDVRKVRRLPGYWLGTKPTDLGYQPNQGIGTPEYTTTPGEDFTPEVRSAQSNVMPGALQKLTQNAMTPVTMFSNYTTQAAANAAKEAGQVGVKAGLNTVGKAAGIAGAAYGTFNQINDILHAGDTRSEGDMAKTMAVNTYYTPGGHSYTRHSGLNLQNELNYGKAQRDSSRIGYTLDAMGTGASVGGLAGGWLGAGIGAAAGLLQGIGASIFGFGDNTDKIRERAQNLMESTARSDRQSEALAKNLDVRDAFSNRMHAANGKRPVITGHGFKDGTANAMVSNGETIVPKDGPGYVVPGAPNKKDSVRAKLKDSDAVLSNNGGSQYYQLTGDLEGALQIDDYYRTMIKGNRYANGKLPRFTLGTAGEYALSVLPHMGQYFSSLQAYNRAKNASTYVPSYEGYNALGAKAINDMRADMIDPREYLNRSTRSYNQAAWNARRTPGLGLGGRAIALDSLYKGKLAQDTDTLMRIDEANRNQRNTASNMAYNLGDKYLSTNYDNFWRRYAAQQQANAAKENYMAQYEKNKVMAGINGAADLLRMNQYNRAYDQQSKIIDLHYKNYDLKRLRSLRDWQDSAPENINSAPKTYRPFTKDELDIIAGRKGFV